MLGVTMEGRERVRKHLAGRGADRPPLIAFATDFAARLEQVEPLQLWDDAGILTRTLMGLDALFGLDAIVVERSPSARSLLAASDGCRRRSAACARSWMIGRARAGACPGR